jgi:hypothetical protein
VPRSFSAFRARPCCIRSGSTAWTKADGAEWRAALRPATYLDRRSWRACDSHAPQPRDHDRASRGSESQVEAGIGQAGGDAEWRKGQVPGRGGEHDALLRGPRCRPVWTLRTNKGDAEGLCRHGKNCRPTVNNCSGSGAPVGGSDVLGRRLHSDPLF